jgi:ribonuclease Z
MDHIAGFDAFFRKNYSREHKENHLWGPPGADQILSARFQGYLWNLCDTGPNSSWWVHEIHENRILSFRRELHDAFRTVQEISSRPREGALVFRTEHYSVEAIHLPHHTTSLGYLITEADRLNFSQVALQQLNVQPGPWTSKLKRSVAEAHTGERDPNEPFEIGNYSGTISEWKERLFEVNQGRTVAYMTDFRLDIPTRERLADFLKNRFYLTLLCESQYAEEDLDLAKNTAHSTCQEAALLAAAVQPESFLLFHISDRYRPLDRERILRQAQTIYPMTQFAWESDAP